MFSPNILPDVGTIPLKAPEVDASQVGAELVLLDAEGRIVRGLNRTAARVWELIDGHRSLAQIAGCVATEFRVPADFALEGVLPFVATLAEKKLVVLEGPRRHSIGEKP